MSGRVPVRDERLRERLVAGGGEMGKLVRRLDWSKTPLGPLESWPQSLRTTVSLCLASNFPISIAWGPERTQIYNDGYWPICGAKHPESMGQDFRECWFSAWPAIGDAFDSATAGETRFLTNQRMFLDRNGYLEETFFTFSFSPIRDESGGVGGLFHPVTELTQQSIAERRLKVLRAVADRTSDAKSVEEALVQISQVLAPAELDLPFTLVYLVEPGEARLAAHTGLVAGTAAAPRTIRLDPDLGGGWPLGRIVASGSAEAVADLTGRFGAFACGPYPEVPHTAVVTPIWVPGVAAPFAVLVAAASPRRPLDEQYGTFFAMLADAVTSALTGARSYEEERARAEALAELDRAKTAFFSNVSHEFRTPLTLMLGPLEDALAQTDAPLDARTTERLTVAHRNSLRLLKLVNTLLDFSRIEAGRIQGAYEPTDVGAFTAELASVFRSAVERAGLWLTVTCEPVAAPVYLDREMWEKVVLNLLSNAFKFTTSGGIAVTVRERGPDVVVSVRDTGTGIPADELPHVFERFHRVRGAHGRTHEGTGIGLALVQELVKLHGGTVSVESEVGAGSVFTVSVPTGSAHLPRERINAPRTLASTALGAAPFVEEALRWLPDDLRGAAEEDGGAQAGVSTTGARVLLADDNMDMREYLRRLLARHWSVEAVADGEAALAAIRRAPPDLVLSDVMMPRLDGFGLLKAIRADPALRTMPVLLLSARAGEEARVEGLDAGADDYLIKPFSARELVARVNTHLEMARVRKEELRAREAMARQLRESEERFRNMADNAPVMTWVTEPDGQCTYLSKSWYEFTGSAPDSGLGTGWVQTVHPDDRDEAERAFLAANARQEAFRLEYRLRRHDGAYRWAIDSAVPRFGPAGEFLGYIGSVIDIAERKEMEEALREADRRKDEFLAMLAHELRNPLAPIRNASRMLSLVAPDEPRIAQACDIIERQTTHVTRLVDDLLDVSRITRGKISLQREPIMLAAVVHAAVELGRPLVDRLGQTLTVSHHHEAIHLEGDFARLVQVVSNLLTNAAKFTPAGGRITLTTQHADGAAIIRVRDTGMGIAPELQERIFELFVQQEGGLARTQGGLGIGLTLVKRIVEMHEGTVEARSEGPGRGSEFVVRLPARAPRTLLPAPPPRLAGGSQPLRILLVEDNPDAAQSFTMVLELGGHTLRVAHRGERALELVDDFAPDVAFVDVGLPGMDGYELAGRLRAHPACRSALLVALTGYGRDEDKRRAVEAGFDHHLTKPVDFEAIDRILESASRPAHPREEQRGSAH